MVLTILILMLLFIAGGFISFLPSPSSTKLHSWLRSFLIRNPPSVPKDTATAPHDSHKEMCAIKEAELKSVFATFDKNGDGFITKQELRESLKNITIFITEKDVEEMVMKVDSNGDGLIDFQEFCLLCETLGGHDQDLGQMSWGGGIGSGGVEEEGRGERDLKEAFDVFDKDKDGLISVEELNLVFSSLGLKEGERVEDCSEMIKKVDMDGDGMVNFDEFKRMMRGTGAHNLVCAF